MKKFTYLIAAATIIGVLGIVGIASADRTAVDQFLQRISTASGGTIIPRTVSDSFGTTTNPWRSATFTNVTVTGSCTGCSGSLGGSNTQLQYNNSSTFGGANVYYISSSGNLGVGSTTPTGKLTVTNTGAGDSFVVEDSTSPDTTPFKIDAAGRVMVGTTTLTNDSGVFQINQEATNVPNLILGNTTNKSISALGFSRARTVLSASLAGVIQTVSDTSSVTGAIEILTNTNVNPGVATSSARGGLRVATVGGTQDSAYVQIMRFTTGLPSDRTSILEPQLRFTSEDSVQNEQDYAKIGAYVMASTSAAEVGDLLFYTVNSGSLTEKMRITGAGNFGIASGTPTAKLTVNGDTYLAGSLYATSTVTLTGLTGATGGTNQDLCISTAKVVINETTGTCVVSSRRFKNNIVPLDIGGLISILKLKPIEYSYNDDDVSDYKDRQYGFIAEDVADVDPHFAKYGIDGLPRTLDDRALLSVSIKAIQELKAENDSLKARIEKLEKLVK